MDDSTFVVVGVAVLCYAGVILPVHRQRLSWCLRYDTRYLRFNADLLEKILGSCNKDFLKKKCSRLEWTLRLHMVSCGKYVSFEKMNYGVIKREISDGILSLIDIFSKLDSLHTWSNVFIKNVLKWFFLNMVYRWCQRRNCMIRA